MSCHQNLTKILLNQGLLNQKWKTLEKSLLTLHAMSGNILKTKIIYQKWNSRNAFANVNRKYAENAYASDEMLSESDADSEATIDYDFSDPVMVEEV